MTAPPPAWAVDVDSTGGENVDDARLVAIADQLDALVATSAETLAGPVIGAHVPTGTLRFTITVAAATPEDAARQAAAAFRQATAAAGLGLLRVAAADTVEPTPVGA